MRIVSLLPSATEIVCLLGGRGFLVGRSHECDYPAGLGEVPVLTGPGTALGATPVEIDAEVRARLAEGQSLYTLDTDLLHRLRPDLILTQDLCKVCSIDLGTVRAVAAGMKPEPRVVSLNPHGVEDVLDDVFKVGEATGMTEAADEAVVKLKERMWRAADFVNPYTEGPRVGFLEWTEPLFVGGHWTPQLIERAGGRHLLNPTVAEEDSGAAAGPQAWARRAGASRRVDVEEFVESSPEVLVVCPCGVGLEGAVGMVRELGKKEWWGALPAVKAAPPRVAVVDGNQMFNRPGPRLVDAFEWLVGYLNDRPELIPAGFPWRRLG